jgi:hypothetical protein
MELLDHFNGAASRLDLGLGAGTDMMDFYFEGDF